MQDELLVIILFAGLILVILLIISLWKAFEKAGEAGWKAIVPIYNVYIMYKIAGMKNWFWYTMILAFVLGIFAGISPNYGEIITSFSSIFCGIVGIVACFLFARKYGWEIFSSILFTIFTPICMLILGLGDSKYDKKHKNSVNEVLIPIITSIAIFMFLLFIVGKYSDGNSKRVLSDEQEILIDSDKNIDFIENLILGEGVYWGMTIDEIKKIYGLNEKYLTKEGLSKDEKEVLRDNIAKYYNRLSFKDNEGVKWELWFFKYDKAYRLYSIRAEYNWNQLSFNDAQTFLDENFGKSKEKNMKQCFTCKEGYQYNENGTSAWLLKDLGSNYFESQNIIDNFKIEYESDYIGEEIINPILRTEYEK